MSYPDVWNEEAALKAPLFLFQRGADLFQDSFCFAIFVCFVRPGFQAVAFETRNDVHVRVVNDLPSMFPVIHHLIDPVGIGRFFNLYRDLAYRFLDACPILR